MPSGGGEVGVVCLLTFCPDVGVLYGRDGRLGYDVLDVGRHLLKQPFPDNRGPHGLEPAAEGHPAVFKKGVHENQVSTQGKDAHFPANKNVPLVLVKVDRSDVE